MTNKFLDCVLSQMNNCAISDVHETSFNSFKSKLQRILKGGKYFNLIWVLISQITQVQQNFESVKKISGPAIVVIKFCDICHSFIAENNLISREDWILNATK